MVRTVMLGATVAMLFLVAGCAPAALGDPGNPFQLRENRTVVTRAASTVYVVAPFEAGAFGYRVDDLPGRWIPWGPTAAMAQLSALFELREVIAPEGWDVRLEGVRGFDRPSERAVGISVEATLVIEVPPGARQGGQRLRVVLEAGNGRRQTVEFVVQIVS
jgi:hypothetical protein